MRSRAIPACSAAFNLAARKPATSATLADASTKAMTVTLSGVGSVQFGDANNAPGEPVGGSVAYSAIAAGATNRHAIYLWSDGRSGVSTLTVSVNGVVVSTKTYSANVKVDTSSLANGYYIVKLVSAGKVDSLPLIIKK